MSYFDQTRSKKSAIAEGKAQLDEDIEEIQQEADSYAQAEDEMLEEIAAEERRLIVMGRYVDSPDMMTLDEHARALDVIGATPEERRDFEFRVRQITYDASKVKLIDSNDNGGTMEGTVWMRDIEDGHTSDYRGIPRPFSLQIPRAFGRTYL